MKHPLLKLVAGSALILGVLAPAASGVEEAKYTVVQQEGALELRAYAPALQAEVTVNAPREQAGSQAFNRLFRYISGANQRRQEIAMTAPVGQEIPMTAPVGQSPTPEGWTVSFMLPDGFSLENAPVPSDPQVRLRALPARQVASIRYAGGDEEKTYQEHLKALQDWVARQGWKPAGELIWARYNPPFTPPFWRRNEILMPLEP